MKKSLLLFFVLIIAALSVLSASAAYYDQMGNKLWCNSDSYGCWVTGEDGEQVYIMFWSESARDYIMGPGSDAPLGTNPGSATLRMFAPEIVKDGEEVKPECTTAADCPVGWSCTDGKCINKGGSGGGAG